MTGTQRFSSVWDAIEDTPQQAAPAPFAREPARPILAEVFDEIHERPVKPLGSIEATSSRASCTSSTPGIAFVPSTRFGT